ncbi:unnamed protein product [Hymenolepis diminuta]|uniref:Uncharacterized protein n=1 Tax=Hymenolepis diminuta TaxID=6216 RepID=A0A564YSB6_HYMDI|nr:unnamed protein product [Hymenolepis diminuta]
MESFRWALFPTHLRDWRLRERKLLNRIRWMNIGLYRGLRVAVELNSVEKLRQCLNCYNYITKISKTPLSRINVKDGALKFAVCGPVTSCKVASAVSKAVVNVHRENKIILRSTNFRFFLSKDFDHLTNLPEFLSRLDALFIVTSLSKNLRGWRKTVKFFKDVKRYFRSHRSPRFVYILDGKKGTNFGRLIRLFRMFVPLTSINLQPGFEVKTNIKLWRLSWKMDKISNLNQIFTEACTLCNMKRHRMSHKRSLGKSRKQRESIS